MHDAKLLLLLFFLYPFIAHSSLSNGPVIAENFPDPSFIHVNDTYYAFSTNSGHGNVPVATSTDFVNWTFTQDALPSLGNWTSGKTWALDVTQVVSIYCLFRWRLLRSRIDGF